jgi:beta-glucosidase-like glycosyl hydrolase
MVGVIDDKTRGFMTNNVTSDDHKKISRKLAEEGIILMKNEDKILPLDLKKHGQKILVIGGTTEKFLFNQAF